MSVLLFEIDRAEVAEGGVQTLPIVPNLNVLKDRGVRESLRGKLAGHTFSFQGTEETFRHGIIVAVTNPAHADLHFGG